MEDDEDDNDNDGSDVNGVAEWNLRKCSAAALDNLSMTFGATHVLPALLPALEVRLFFVFREMVLGRGGKGRARRVGIRYYNIAGGRRKMGCFTSVCIASCLGVFHL